MAGMKDTSSNIAHLGAKAEPQGADRPATDAQAGASTKPGFLRQVAPGLVMIVLGVTSHLWLDARRGVETTPELAGADVAALVATVGDRPAVATPSAAVAATHELGSRAERRVAPGDGPGPLPGRTGNTMVAAVATPAAATNPTARGASAEQAVVGTTGSMTTSRAIATAAPPAAEAVDAGGHAGRSAEPVLITSAVTDELEIDMPEEPAWRVVKTLDAAHAVSRPVIGLPDFDVAPLAASLPSAPNAIRPAEAELTVEDTDEHSIRRVLEQYQLAFNQLDVRAATRVWPAVDQRALARAFSHLQAQSITLEECGVTTMNTSAAHARCRGVATYLPKVGRGPMQLTREWNFTLARTTGNDWRIQAVH
jgi:hypothetical protein